MLCSHRLSLDIDRNTIWRFCIQTIWRASASRSAGVGTRTVRRERPFVQNKQCKINPSEYTCLFHNGLHILIRIHVNSKKQKPTVKSLKLYIIIELKGMTAVTLI